jgi:hypothetical protein
MGTRTTARRNAARRNLAREGRRIRETIPPEEKREGMGGPHALSP